MACFVSFFAKDGIASDSVALTDKLCKSRISLLDNKPDSMGGKFWGLGRASVYQFLLRKAVTAKSIQPAVPFPKHSL